MEAEGSIDVIEVAARASATLRYGLGHKTGGALAANVDFTFNLGAWRLQTSTEGRRVNRRNWVAATRELRRWVYDGRKILPGFVARRTTEAPFLAW
jgi:lysozyme